MSNMCFLCAHPIFVNVKCLRLFIFVSRVGVFVWDSCISILSSYVIVGCVITFVRPGCVCSSLLLCVFRRRLKHAAGYKYRVGDSPNYPKMHRFGTKPTLETHHNLTECQFNKCYAV